MVKPHDDSFSNNLEIVSIGTLYSGQWDKKYWSSSRGKDRYPYPIGYQSLRTHNGITYKMEVYEGTRGPIFQITSNDKKSGVGETPDRAWENFQKKGCSRVKLWPGKRFSGKFDGLEFFGFKNALVQRLLRELLASVNDASSQSSQFTNVSKASAEGQDAGYPLKDRSPELMSSLDKTKFTGKKRRTCRAADTKSACKKSQKICRPLNEADIGKDPCNTRMANNCELIISPTRLCEIDQADGPLLLLSDMELRKNVPLSGHSLPIKYIEVLDDSKAKSSIVDGQSDLASREKGSCVSLPHENKSFDRQCTRVREHELSAVTEVEYGNAQIVPDGLDLSPPVLTSIQISRSADICAQDISDTRQGIGNVTSRTELVTDMVISEEPITVSHSEDRKCYFTGSSEKSDFDTVGEDTANSMLSVPPPRAFPFLTYSSRKKRRKASSSKELSCGRKSDDTLVGTIPIPIIDDISPACAHAKSDVEGVKRTDPISGHADLFESEMENVKDIVPDSLDDDQSDYLVGNKLPLSYKNAKEVLNDLKEKSEPFGKSSSDLLKATELFYDKSTNNKGRGCKETFNHDEQTKNCGTSVQNDSVPESHFTAGCQTYIPTNRFLEGKDHWSTAEADSKFIEHSCKKTEGDTIPDGKDMFSQDSAGFVPKNSSLGKIVPRKAEYSTPLSESIIFRNNGDNCAPEKDREAETLVSSDFCQLHGISNNDQSRTSLNAQGKLERQISHPKDENAQEALGQNSTHSILQAQEHALNCAFTMDGVIDGFGVHVRNSQHNHRKNKTGAQHCESVYHTSDPRGGGSQYCTSHIKEDIAYTGVNCPAKQKRSEIKDNMKLIGCYSHLVQISSVKLAHIGHEIYICVSCGPAEDGKRDLFLYKLSSKEPSQGRPDMVGHTSIRLPLFKDEFGREVAMDKSGLQFTPDASGLVLIDSIRMSYCRENNLNCSCPQCESCCFEENAVKIVQIQHGYASVILKLNTIYAVHCILVCEPQCLIAVDESGRIYIWIMDPTWSQQMKQHIIMSNDFLPSRIIELKRVPKSSSMVIGHNGYGQFSLWDIAKRTVVSQFSAPANSVLEYLPVSLFRCQSNSVSSEKIFMEERVKKLVEETTLWFSGHNEVNISCLTDEKDIALWVLMYTSSDSSVPSASSSSNCCSYLDGCWRLCLLVKSTVIMGAALPSSTAIGTSSGIGIIGTYEGHVDIWELLTGNQLGSLHHRAGKRVSHVAVDDSSSSVIAIAHDDGQLCVYLRH